MLQTATVRWPRSQRKTLAWRPAAGPTGVGIASSSSSASAAATSGSTSSEGSGSVSRTSAAAGVLGGRLVGLGLVGLGGLGLVGGGGLGLGDGLVRRGGLLLLGRLRGLLGLAHADSSESVTGGG